MEEQIKEIFSAFISDYDVLNKVVTKFSDLLEKKKDEALDLLAGTLQGGISNPQAFAVTLNDILTRKKNEVIENTTTMLEQLNTGSANINIDKVKDKLLQLWELKKQEVTDMIKKKVLESMSNMENFSPIFDNLAKNIVEDNKGFLFKFAEKIFEKLGKPKKDFPVSTTKVT